MVNKVILVGNLGKDPEVRSTATGQQVTTFSLATNRVWRDKNGEKQEKTEWHNIKVWGKQAEIAGRYLTRGKTIFLEGRIETRSYDDKKTGEKRYITEIVCDNFQMIGGPRSSDASRPAAPNAAESHGPAEGGYEDPGHFAGGDDDIPF
jgi:single-strand DNA-binding protein